MGNSLVVQWLGSGAFTAMAWVQSPVGELRSRKPRSVAKINIFLQKRKLNYGNTSCLAFFQGVKYGNTYRPAMVNFLSYLVCKDEREISFLFSFAFEINPQRYIYLFIIRENHFL